MSAPDSGSLPTRDSLLSRIRDLGDDASWREFCEIYWELIFNFARKAGLANAEAQDVVQETFIAVSRNIGGFRTGAEHGSFKAWLLQQTRWRIADQFRKRDRLDSFQEPSSADHGRPSAADDQTGTATANRIPDPATLDSDAAWDAEWEQHLLKLVLERVKAKVSVKRFQMFDLHALQGLSAKDTAQTLGATTMAVHMATSRVRRLLRREIASFERGGQRRILCTTQAFPMQQEKGKQ